MTMLVRVSEHDVAGAIAQGDLSLGYILTVLAGNLADLDAADMVTAPTASTIASSRHCDTTTGFLRDILSNAERSARAAG